MIANLTLPDYTVMAVDLAAVTGIGIWFSRGDKDTDTYLLGGRAMPWWLIGIS
jgi:Na+/proline symporter